MARDESRTLEEMVNVLVAMGPFAYGTDIVGTAQEWLEAGFSPEMAHEWLDTARCYEPATVKLLLKHGFDPDIAGAKVNGKPLGFLVANGDMTLEEACERTAPLRKRQDF